MKKYWLVLHQDTFLWTKDNEGLVYNASDKHSCFRFANQGTIARITNDLLQTENLYRSLVTEEELATKEVKEWVDTLLAFACGELVDIEDKTRVAVSLKPILKIQDTVAFYQVAHENNTDGKIIQNLLRLVIHLNGSDYGNDQFAKQIVFPKQHTGIINESSAIKEFIMSMGKPNFLIEIVLVGNIWEYPEYENLIDFLQSLSIHISIYCTEEDFMKHNGSILQTDLISYHPIKTNYNTSCSNDKSLSYHFVVSTEYEYDIACETIEKENLRNAQITPIYTGDNHSFFESLVYVTEEDIQDFQLSKREIFARQAININYFGTLIVDMDGSVYGNLNEEALGTMDDGLYMLTYSEMTRGRSWLRVRDEKPCCDCLYQWLCPSPSNYEQVIGKPNLCHIKKNK